MRVERAKVYLLYLSSPYLEKGSTPIEAKVN